VKTAGLEDADEYTKEMNMNNLVVLQKDDDGHIICRQLTDKGIAHSKSDAAEEDDMWEEGGTIVLSELEEILDRVI
jgi:hypothetical protein